MEKVVPSELEIKGPNQKAVIQVTVESLNLTYSLSVPTQALLEDVERFALDRIILPLATYDRNEVWLKAEELHFCWASAPETVLGSSTRIGQLPLATGDRLRVLLIAKVSMVAAPTTPKKPVESLNQYYEALKTEIFDQLTGVVECIQRNTAQQNSVDPPYVVLFQPVNEAGDLLKAVVVVAIQQLNSRVSDEKLQVSFKEIERLVKQLDRMLHVNTKHPIWRQPLAVIKEAVCRDVIAFISTYVDPSTGLDTRMRFHFFAFEELSENFFDWNNYRLVPSDGRIVNLSLKR